MSSPHQKIFMSLPTICLFLIGGFAGFLMFMSPVYFLVVLCGLTSLFFWGLGLLSWSIDGLKENQARQPKIDPTDAMMNLMPLLAYATAAKAQAEYYINKAKKRRR